MIWLVLGVNNFFLTVYKIIVINLKEMKRRSHTATNQQPKSSKPSTKHPPSPNNKKRNIKSCHDKNSKNRKKAPEEYVMIRDTVYKADTKTQR